MKVPKMKVPKLSKYPKSGLSFSQLEDEKKLEAYEKATDTRPVCPLCKHDKFMMTTMGLRLCEKCYHCIGFRL